MLLRAFAVVALAITLTACGTGGGMSAAERHQDLLAKAKAGDAGAQFSVGESLCCGTGGAHGQRDIAAATQWLCKAAHQGDQRAQYRLGTIYSGELTEGGFGFGLLRRITERDEPATRMRLAAMWFDLAMAGGSDRAATKRLALTKRMTPEDLVAVEKMRARWRQEPCEWQAVYGPGHSS